jgi:hypothetical protein
MAVTPPPFTFQSVIDTAMRASARQNRSPVRYLALEGDKPRRRTKMRWNPSSLDGCVRKNVYKAHGCPPDPNFSVDLETQMIFDRGTVIGAWIAAYVRAAEGYDGIEDVRCQALDREEELATDPAVGLGGFIDIQFTKGGRRYLVEVKSKDNDAAMDKITRPDPTQLKQLNDYMAKTGIHSGWIVYIGLAETPKGQSLRIIEFPHVFSASLWGESQRQIRLLEMMYRAPDRLGPTSNKPWFECRSCPYKKNLCDPGITPAQAKGVVP